MDNVSNNGTQGFNSLAADLMRGSSIVHFTCSGDAGCFVTSDDDGDLKLHLMNVSLTDGVLSFSPFGGMTSKGATDAGAALFYATRWVAQKDYQLREARAQSLEDEVEAALRVAEMAGL